MLARGYAEGDTELRGVAAVVRTRIVRVARVVAPAVHVVHGLYHVPRPGRDQRADVAVDRARDFVDREGQVEWADPAHALVADGELCEGAFGRDESNGPQGTVDGRAARFDADLAVGHDYWGRRVDEMFGPVAGKCSPHSRGDLLVVLELWFVRYHRGGDRHFRDSGLEVRGFQRALERGRALQDAAFVAHSPGAGGQGQRHRPV
ncbi:MAG: hypothetical protein O3B01_11730 [Planctomycetota bacterium]|nr:hypothetical protein [Planctomycetota bacterium]